MKSPWIDQKPPRAPASPLDSGGWSSSSSAWSSPLRPSLLAVCSRLGVGSRNSQSLPYKQFCCTICIWEHEFFFLLWYQDFFRFNSSGMNFWCIHIFQFLNICNQNIFFPNSPRDQCKTPRYSRQNFFTKLMEPWLVFRRNRTILNHGTKRNHCSFAWFSKSPLIWCFPIFQEVSNMSKITATFQSNSPPFCIQAGLQHHSTRAFLCPAYSSFRNTIGLRSMEV